MSSFIAAGTAYSSHGMNMIPIFIYYSMFGFQRIGDLIWAAADARAKGFMLGGTAGRTTLNGEGLQHQDGHSLLNAMAFPTVRAYDPAYAYETAVIVFDGLQADVRGQRNGDLLHHARERKLRDARDARRVRRRHHPRHVPELPSPSTPRATATRAAASAAGPILRESLRAAEILAEKIRHRQRRLERDQLQRNSAATPRNASAGTCSTPTKPRAILRGAATRGDRRPVHRRQRLHAGPGRADRPLGARRTVRAGHRRHGPQRKRARRCGGTSKSTPSASSSPRSIDSASCGKFDREEVAQAIKDLGVDPEKNRHCMPEAQPQ